MKKIFSAILKFFGLLFLIICFAAPFINDKENKENNNKLTQSSQPTVKQEVNNTENIFEIFHKKYNILIDKAKNGNSEDKEKLISFLKENSHSDNVDAQYCLGRQYFSGKNIKEDVRAAFYWFEKSFNNRKYGWRWSNEWSAYFLAGAFEYGWGNNGEPDLKKAYEYYKLIYNTKDENLDKYVKRAYQRLNDYKFLVDYLQLPFRAKHDKIDIFKQFLFSIDTKNISQELSTEFNKSKGYILEIAKDNDSFLINMGKWVVAGASIGWGLATFDVLTLSGGAVSLWNCFSGADDNDKNVKSWKESHQKIIDFCNKNSISTSWWNTTNKLYAEKYANK